MKRVRPVDEHDVLLGVRLREEIKRLGINVWRAASICGVTGRTAYYWLERTQHHPSAHDLLRLHQAGFDIMYVVTGARSVSVAVDCKPGDNGDS